MYTKYMGILISGIVLLAGILAYAQPMDTNTATGVAMQPVNQVQLNADLQQVQEIQDNLKLAGDIVEAI